MNQILQTMQLERNNNPPPPPPLTTHQKKITHASSACKIMGLRDRV
jgi:hypothetical protein